MVSSPTASESETGNRTRKRRTIRPRDGRAVEEEEEEEEDGIVQHRQQRRHYWSAKRFDDVAREGDHRRREKTAGELKRLHQQGGETMVRYEDVQLNLENQKSFSVVVDHAVELREIIRRRWFETTKEKKEIVGFHRSSYTERTTNKKTALNREHEQRKQHFEQKDAFSHPHFGHFRLDPRLKQYAIYFACILMLETKITITGIQEIVPNENRVLTPDVYSVYVKNVLTRFVPLQLAIDAAFLSLGVRKQIGARGTFEYDRKYEEKLYFWRQMIKTFLRHPQVTLFLAGVYGPISHEFTKIQFGAIAFMPLIIGKYNISRYSSFKYSLFYSIMSISYAFLFQFSAPAVRELWFENKFETYWNVIEAMYSRCSMHYMAFIFLVPMVMHLMYVVVNARGTSKKFINLTLATTTSVDNRAMNRFHGVRSGRDDAVPPDEQNVKKEEILDEGVLGFGIHLKSRSKRLRDSPPSSQNTSEDGSDGEVLDLGRHNERRNKRSGLGGRRGDTSSPEDPGAITAYEAPTNTAAPATHVLSFVNVPDERHNFIGELCGRSVEDECVAMDGTHVVIHPPPPSPTSSSGNMSGSASILSALKSTLSARNILFPYSKKIGVSGYTRNAETIRLVYREFMKVLQNLKELHSKSVVVLNDSNGESHDLSVRTDGKGSDVMTCSVWRGFTPEDMPIRAIVEKIKPSKCAIGVGRGKKTAYTDIHARVPFGTATKTTAEMVVKSQSRFPRSCPRIISVSPMCVLPGVKTRIQIHGRSLKNMTLCARLHGKNDIEEIFIHSSDQKYMEENEHGQSMTSSKLRPTLSERHRAERCRRAMWMKEYKMRLHASDETKEDELDKLEEDMRGGKGEVSLINENIDMSNSISSFSSDTSSDCEQIEQAPLETVYVDVCVDSLYDGGFFFLQFLNVPFASTSIPIVVTPFLDVKREINAQLSNKKLGDCARVVLYKCAEVTGGRGMDWNTDSFADACERDLGCPRFADLVRAAKSK